MSVQVKIDTRALEKAMADKSKESMTNLFIILLIQGSQ